MNAMRDPAESNIRAEEVLSQRAPSSPRGIGHRLGILALSASLARKIGPVRPKNGVWKAFLDFFALKWANNGCYYGFGGMSGTKMRVGDSRDRM